MGTGKEGSLTAFECRWEKFRIGTGRTGKSDSVSYGSMGTVKVLLNLLRPPCPRLESYQRYLSKPNAHYHDASLDGRTFFSCAVLHSS